jgi:drug/metabolite transporter (DMT)-like permease
MAVLLAGLAAFGMAASQVTVKRALHTNSVVGSLLVNMGVAWLVLVIAVVLQPPPSVPLSSLGFFVLAGLLAPGVSRWASIMGVDRLGPSISVSVLHGVRPTLAVLGAVVFLGESIGVPRAVGIAGIVLGVVWLSRSREDETSLAMEELEVGDARRTSTQRSMFDPAVAFPLIAALSFAVADLLIKQGLREMPNPSFGAMVALGSAVTTWTIAVLSVPGARKKIKLGRGLGWLVATGVFGGGGVLLFFHALERGDVAIVSPIVAGQPLLVFLLSRLMLRGSEPIGARTVLAGVLVVAGAVIISLYG